jgi:hypothetical protein
MVCVMVKAASSSQDRQFDWAAGAPKVARPPIPYRDQLRFPAEAIMTRQRLPRCFCDEREMNRPIKAGSGVILNSGNVDASQHFAKADIP